MMYYTHLAFGVLISLTLVYFLNVNNILFFVSIALFFSIFPDIDETRSKIGRENRVISKVINFFFGHRGIFHTVYMPLIIFITLNLVNFEIAIASLAGYFSHLFLDAITRQGIKPFYPLYRKRINGPFRTNSIAEKIIFLVIAITSIYLILSFI